MSFFTYPFWIVTERRGTQSQPVTLAGAPGYAVAFTTAMQAVKYLAARNKPTWDFEVVNRFTVRPMIARFRQLGLKGICLDPTDNACGETVDFDQIM